MWIVSRPLAVLNDVYTFGASLFLSSTIQTSGIILGWRYEPRKSAENNIVVEKPSVSMVRCNGLYVAGIDNNIILYMESIGMTIPFEHRKNGVFSKHCFITVDHEIIKWNKWCASLWMEKKTERSYEQSEFVICESGDLHKIASSTYLAHRNAKADKY